MMENGQSVWGFYKSFNEQDYLSEYVKQPKPLPLGISALDRALAPDDGLGGIPSGIPTILGGEPGCGKSAIGTTALYNAPFNGMLPMFFTIEMTRQMVLSRLLSIHTDAKRRNELSNGAKFNERTAQVFWSSTGNVIRSHTGGNVITEDEEAQRYIMEHRHDDPVIIAWNDFYKTIYRNIMVVDTYVDISTGQTSPVLTADRICEMVRNVIDGGFKHVFPIIDYLQLTLDGASGDSEYEMVNHASSAFRALAKEHRIPVLVLSSLRNVTQAERKEPPTLSQFKGSGNIGYDAGTAIVLRRDPEAEGDEHSVETPVRAYIIKNRVGPPDGQVALWFNGATNTFRER